MDVLLAAVSGAAVSKGKQVDSLLTKNARTELVSRGKKLLPQYLLES